MANRLHTDKVEGERIYYRKMQDAFEPVDRNDEFIPCIVESVYEDGSCRLQHIGMRALSHGMWLARWVDCFSGRDILQRAANYTDFQRIQHALPGQHQLYKWYQIAQYELWDLLVTKRIAG